jgi:hypothetical protein
MLAPPKCCCREHEQSRLARLPTETALTGARRRAAACGLGQGIALVGVRDLAVRGHPLVFAARYPGEAEAWLQAHGHGLRGQVPSPPAGVLR